jgi:acyl transferase domain-containing protein
VQSNVKGGFFLSEDLARFDAPFFGFTKAEAASLDPEQRLLLECAYETLEDAGMTLESFSGSETGVYVGTFLSDWGEITRRDPDAMPLYQPTGSGHSMLAGRLSYFYNLKGPSMTVDTACSASFVALHNACSALRNGDCTSALVGGVNSIMNHDFLSTMSSMQFLSPDGRSYSYDERANGYARGEGVVTILIKPLDKALRDGDCLRGIIRGIGLNQDGKTPGITHPSQSQQAALIRKVYERAGLDPNETSYVETHGTGTQVGDVIEAKALYEAFGRTRNNAEPLLVGSIKTNIGHLEGASGLAGLVKVLMMLENELILPNSGFTKPNERIKLDEWNMEVSLVVKACKGQQARLIEARLSLSIGSDPVAALEANESSPSIHQQFWIRWHKCTPYC